jgi:hypothetical protein
VNKNKKKRNVKSKTTDTTVVTYDVLKVFWKDHFSGNRNWVSDVKDLRVEPFICTTVGYKVFEDKETLTLAQNLGENFSMADTTTILKACITKREVISNVQFQKTKA